MLVVLNKKLAVQKVAVTAKTAACEALLEEIAAGTTQASEKKEIAQSKGKEMEEQSVVIVKEKVSDFVVVVFLFPQTSEDKQQKR